MATTTTQQQSVAFNMDMSIFYENLATLPAEQFGDTKIICTKDGGVFEADKLILAIGSRHFQEEIVKGKTTIELNDMSREAVGDVLDYLYKGTICFKEGTERLRDFLVTVARLGVRGPFEEGEAGELMRSEAPTPPMLKVEDVPAATPTGEADTLKLVTQVSEVLEMLAVAIEGSESVLPLEESEEFVVTEEEIVETSTPLERLPSAPARLLREISDALPAVNELEEEEKIEEVTSEMDDSGMASEDEIDAGVDFSDVADASDVASEVSDAASRTSDARNVIGCWELRYAPYLTPKRNIRARARQSMGISGKFWQCERCEYWAYYKNDIRRHQVNVKH
jgi:hypothetical protein